MSLRSKCRRTILWAALSLGLSSTAHAAAVQLQWDPNSEPGILSYTVAYGTRTGVYTSTVTVGNVTSYTLNLTTPGTYFIAVSATSVGGTSAYSAEVSTVVAGAPVSNPQLMIDGPASSSTVNSDLLLSGWAADLGAPTGPGVDAIHVYAYPNPGSGTAPIFMGIAAYGTARADVAAAYGSQFLNSAYTLPIVGLAPGLYDLVLYGHSTVTNAFSFSRGVRVTVGVPTAPGAKLSLDMPRTGDNIDGALAIGGWAVDQRASSGPGVDGVNVWAYPAPGSGRLPMFLGAATFGGNRSDVASALGNQRFKLSGFDMTVVSLQAGVYDIVAFPHSTYSGGYESPRVARVTIRPSVLIMVDGPANNGTVSRTFAISGWSLDRRATANNGIDALHVWAYPNPGSGTAPIFLGATVTGLPRGDVAAIYGSQFATSGYGLTVTVPQPPTGGMFYDLVVFAQSKSTGLFENAAVVRIKVQ